MGDTVLGIFSERTDAQEAIDALRAEGYNPKDISIVMKNNAEGEQLAKDTGADVASGAASGAATGAILGGIAGIVASTIIPGLGALFIGGPLAAALGLTGAAATTASGAATGALAGGLLGALTSLGLSEKDAKLYNERIKSGGILVAVPAREGEEMSVKQILSESGADDIKSVSMDRDEFTDRDSSSIDTSEDISSYRQP